MHAATQDFPSVDILVQEAVLAATHSVLALFIYEEAAQVKLHFVPSAKT